MTDKEIRTEVERLIKANKISEDKEYAQYELDVKCGYDMALDDILSFINSFQEEPVKQSVDEAMAEIEEKSKAFTEAHKSESADDILSQIRGEEPVSEDLEEAAWVYADKKAHLDKTVFTPNEIEKERNKQQFNWQDIRETFKAGAQWQKQQFDESQHGKELLYVCNKTAERTKREVINKACEWLMSNLQDYAGEDSFRNSVPFDNAVFDDFKKYIEENVKED